MHFQGIPCTNRRLNYTRFGTSTTTARGEIVSNNGTQFVNQLIEHVLKALRTKHTRINAYSHEENRLDERANKEIFRYLRALVNERKIKSSSFCSTIF